MNAKESQRKARITAITLAGLTVFSILCLVFAYIQRMDADRTRELAARCYEQLQSAELLAQQSQAEAERQRAIAEHQTVMAMSALEECKNKKK